MIEVRPLTDDSLPDAEQVVRSRFPVSAIGILHKVMRNPMRKVCAEAGDIAYEDGRPIAFQALSGREMLFGSESLRGNVGGMTVLSEGASVEAMIDIKAASVKNRIGHRMGFGNTLCAATEKMARKTKDLLGPESCCWYRFKPIRPLVFLGYCIRRKVLKLAMPSWTPFNSLATGDFVWTQGDVSVRRLFAFDPGFDDFWQRYRETNLGLVCSRTKEELDWIFGDEVAKGTAALLATYRGADLVGFVVLKDESDAGSRWQIMDWIALRNEATLLDALLAASVAFLRERTPAMLLESIGFPTFIQPVLKRHLPFRRTAGNNFFSYGYRKRKTEGKAFAEACEAVIDTPKSWFFGPYDGDMCM